MNRLLILTFLFCVGYIKVLAQIKQPIDTTQLLIGTWVKYKDSFSTGRVMTIENLNFDTITIKLSKDKTYKKLYSKITEIGLWEFSSNEKAIILYNRTSDWWEAQKKTFKMGDIIIYLSTITTKEFIDVKVSDAIGAEGITFFGFYRKLK